MLDSHKPQNTQDHVIGEAYNALNQLNEDLIAFYYKELLSIPLYRSDSLEYAQEAMSKIPSLSLKLIDIALDINNIDMGIQVANFCVGELQQNGLPFFKIVFSKLATNPELASHYIQLYSFARNIYADNEEFFKSELMNQIIVHDKALTAAGYLLSKAYIDDKENCAKIIDIYLSKKHLKDAAEFARSVIHNFPEFTVELYKLTDTTTDYDFERILVTNIIYLDLKIGKTLLLKLIQKFPIEYPGQLINYAIRPGANYRPGLKKGDPELAAKLIRIYLSNTEDDKPVHESAAAAGEILNSLVYFAPHTALNLLKEIRYSISNSSLGTIALTFLQTSFFDGADAIRFLYLYKFNPDLIGINSSDDPIYQFISQITENDLYLQVEKLLDYYFEQGDIELFMTICTMGSYFSKRANSKFKRIADKYKVKIPEVTPWPLIAKGGA